MVWSSGAALTATQLNQYLPQAWSTWAPTISNTTGTYTTVTITSARYIQYGKTVHYALNLTITNVGTAAGTLRFTLPATAAASAGTVGYGRENGVTGFMLQAALASTTLANVLAYDNTVVYNANGRQVLMSGTYEAA